MTATTLVPPPGQLDLWPATPAARPASLRVVTLTGSTPAIRDLPIAALQADHAATTHGEAWLIASDGTWAHVTATGTVTPSTGWAAAACRIINTRRSTTP